MAMLNIPLEQLGRVCDGRYCDISGLRSQHKPGQFKNSGHVADKGHSPSLIEECAQFPKINSSVLLVLKTGASEAYSKIPTQLMTMLRCLPNNFLIFSDMSEEIAGHTVYDSLDAVLEDIKKTNKDFDIYHRQKNCPIEHDQCNRGYNTGSEGWNLDKYKNIHMAEKAYRMKPGYDWYFFIDADTYVSIATLMQWLPQLDPHKPHYIGSVVYEGSFPFAHGGSGYMVSQSTMKSMFFGRNGVANSYDEPVQHVCCGDLMWGKAVKDLTGLDLENAVCADYRNTCICRCRFLMYRATVADSQWRTGTVYNLCQGPVVPATRITTPSRCRGN